VLEGVAGIRPKAAARLKVKDLSEMRIDGNTVIFEKIPTMIKVPAQFSKNKKPYFTFLIEEGCPYLKTMLDQRLTKEKLEPDNYIFRDDGTNS